MAVIHETKVKKKCKHHWIIERPSGEFSKGVCKKCGAVKMFGNAEPLVGTKFHVPKSFYWRPQSP